MRRSEWKNLNGLWNYAITAQAASRPGAFTGQILVPYPYQSALSGVMRPLSPTHAIWYHRTFQVPAAWRGRHILLHFDACAWRASIYLNGRLIASHQGSYSGFTVDVTSSLDGQKSQSLLVKVWNPVGLKIEPRGKQVMRAHGMFFSACTGLWGTVWLEPVPARHIRHLIITPDVSRHAVLVRVATTPVSPPAEVRAAVYRGKRLIAQVTARAGSVLRIGIPHPALWSPAHPELYQLRVELMIGGKRHDRVASYFGMRSVTLGPGPDGKMRILLNGKPIFERGALYQGYWPDGLYTPPTDAAMRFDLRTAKAMGFNLLRVHQIVEPQRFYYWADRLGLLVWQDMPAAWPPVHPEARAAIRRQVMASRHWWPANGPQTAAQKLEYVAELKAVIRQNRNHPSIVVWTLFNEGWGQHDTGLLTALIQKLDPSRLVDDASGWFDRGAGNIIETHHYPDPQSAAATESRAATCGEFGGIPLAVPGHYWPGPGRVPSLVIKPGERARLLKRYQHYWAEVRQLRKSRDMCAAVYTELMDQQQEACGLMTFDRKIIKFPLASIRAVTTGRTLRTSQK